MTLMGSQTKVEPGERAVAVPPSSVGASPEDGTEAQESAEFATPKSLRAQSGSEGAGDDEDVSLDELMMSDSNDPEDEQDEATDVHGVVARPEATLESVAEYSVDAAATVEAPASHPFVTSELADDEVAALAAAAAAQEAAAQAASAEADARATAAVADEPASGDTASDSGFDMAAGSATEPGSKLGEPGEANASSVAEPPRDALPGRAAADDEPLVADTSGSVEDLDRFDTEPPMSVELEPPSFQGSELESMPVLAESSAMALGDGPLPSFDIPEPDARARRVTGVAEGEEETRPSSRVGARPLVAPLSQLSEVAEEDDDDAVTHIGLPVPEATNDYPDLPSAGFQIADPTLAALRDFDASLSLKDARRATTRVLPRVDVAKLEAMRAQREAGTGPGHAVRQSLPRIGAWLSGVFSRPPASAPVNDVGATPARNRAAWLLDTVLPPLSLVLFGSGLGAGIMLLQPDRGARAADQTQAVQALKEVPKAPATLIERAETGDGDALFKITNMAADERSSAMTLALERGYQSQKQKEFKEFARVLESPSGFSTPNLTSRFLGFATSPETMLPAFQHLLGWPGSRGPDVLYTVWEKAPGGSRAASLSQQLLHSPDQRAKATPALATALDLRSATSCDDYLRLLPVVQRDGDQRCSATLRALKHKDGCGDDGQQDCYACLRDSTALDDALTAVDGRVPPQL